MISLVIAMGSFWVAHRWVTAAVIGSRYQIAGSR